MCDRTIKMKLNKDSILQDVNSNTNSIELTVKGLDTAIQMRDELQESIDKVESDIDIQLQLENESKYGK